MACSRMKYFLLYNGTVGCQWMELKQVIRYLRVILGLQEVELFLDPFTGFGNCELELPWLRRRPLQRKSDDEC